MIRLDQRLSSMPTQGKSVTHGTGSQQPYHAREQMRSPCPVLGDAHGLSTALRREHDAYACSLRAALLLVGAAPVFLVIAPPSLPVGISRVTIVGLGYGLRATHLLVRAAPIL